MSDSRCWFLGRPNSEAVDGLDFLDAAVDRVRAWERQGNFETIEAITIETAVRLFFEDAKHRNLSPATVSKYDVLLNKQLRPFCSQHKLTYLLELDLLQLRVFRGTWSDSPISASRRLNGYARSFGSAMNRAGLSRTLQAL